MGMIIISAMAKKNRVIGNEQGLTWKIPEEYDNFLRLTKGHPVIMGRNTYDIVTGERADEEKRPDSEVIVVSKSLSEKEVKNYRGAKVCGSLEEAVQRAERLDGTYFCAGGARVYKEAIDKNLAHEMYLSEVDGDYEGTAYFPDFDRRVWKETTREPHEGWDFVVYRNSSKKE